MDDRAATTVQRPCGVTYLRSFLSLQVQPNNYASFYDDGRQNWSLNFDSEQQLANFAKQVNSKQHI